jgi:hypothetical protein
LDVESKLYIKTGENMSKDYSLFRCYWTTEWVLGDFGAAAKVSLPTELLTADYGFNLIGLLKMSPFNYFLVY